MRAFARIVAGTRSAVASSSSTGSSSASSLLRPSRPSPVPRSFSRLSAPSSSSSLLSSRSYANQTSSTTSTSLIDSLEEELGDIPASGTKSTSAISSKALTAVEKEQQKTQTELEEAKKKSQAERAKAEKRMASQQYSPEMWAGGRVKTLHERRQRVAQEGAEDECRWKTDVFRTSVWKLNRVARLIRNMPVDEALIQLRFNEKGTAARLYKSLLDGKRRAIEKGLREERLVISQAYTEKAITIKRILIMGRGRAGRMLKKASRVYFVLKEDVPYVEKLEYKHKKLLKDIKRQGPNRFVNITRRSVKVEYAAKDHWRW